MKTIYINLKDVNSIKEAERKKLRFENLGYKVVAEDVGFTKAVLFMRQIEAV